MQLKKIKRVIMPQIIQMDGNELLQPLPLASMDQFDPFLLLHHSGRVYQPADERPVMDVGPHPHRGFEPITFIFEGAIRHQDSRGNDSVIKTGGVQWMTAGMGIVHSERLAKSFLASGGHLEMIQLWVNLPQKFKMVQPNYQGFQREEIPFISKADGSRINVISGNYEGKDGPVASLTNIQALTLELNAEGVVDIPVAEEDHVMVYQLRGHTMVNEVDVPQAKLVLLEGPGTTIQIQSKQPSLLLYLAGKPIGEPVVSWGPYVMNTQTEIMEAMRDYQMGKMGMLFEG